MAEKIGYKDFSTPVAPSKTLQNALPILFMHAPAKTRHFVCVFFQGLSTFWKGQGSKLAVRGMNLLAELLISEVTSEQLPRYL